LRLGAGRGVEDGALRVGRIVSEQLQVGQEARRRVLEPVAAVGALGHGPAARLQRGAPAVDALVIDEAVRQLQGRRHRLHQLFVRRVLATIEHPCIHRYSF
jgi:hypothetical protein